MRVVHISASDQRGGAALACLRLHKALRAIGTDSSLIVERKSSGDHDVEVVAPFPSEDSPRYRSRLVQRKYVDENRTNISNTHFSLLTADMDISTHPLIAKADVIHLHWIASMQTPAGVHRLLKLDKPVVWTLHDQEPFTGGCHYSAGCRGFEGTCSACPQLKEDPFGLPAAVLLDKLALLRDKNLTVTTSSEWMSREARSSSLFRSMPHIQVVPNGIDPHVFRPSDQAAARTKLGLPLDGAFVLCGAEQWDESRKGLASLPSLIAKVVSHEQINATDVRVMCVGEVPSTLSTSGTALLQLGHLANENDMALAYAAADVFVHLSREDNSPNMILESLSCGTCVVAYAAGGIPEIVHDGINGRLVTVGDEQAMAAALVEVLADGELRRNMGRQARELIQRDHSSTLQADRFSHLYQDLSIARTNRSGGRGRFKAASSTQCDDSVGPGPALSSVLDPVVIYCFEQETRDLEALLTKMSEVAADRSAVIEDLKAECVARAEVIDQLERFRLDHQAKLSQARTKVTTPILQATRHVQRVATASRIGEWWSSKMPSLQETRILKARLTETSEVAADRLAIIEDLKEQLDRAQAESLARSQVIDQLEKLRLDHDVELSQARSKLTAPIIRVARRAQRVATATRFGDWWYSKIPPLLAIAYLQFAASNSSIRSDLAHLAALLFSIVCIAAYGHVINDTFDVESDLQAGKTNAMADYQNRRRALIAVTLALSSYLPTLFVSYSSWSILLVTVNLLLPTIYSIPPLRLKERGVAGLICDLSGSHITPTLLLFSLLAQPSGVLGFRRETFMVVAVTWSGVLGLKGILYHQIADRPHDLQSSTVTFATKARSGTIERWLPRYNFVVEIATSTLLVWAVFDVCPLATVAILSYLFVETLKFRLGFQFAVDPEGLTARASFPFVNESFYVLWLPFAAAVQLAIAHVAWAWLPFVQIGLFGKAFRLQGRDLGAVAHATHVVQLRWQQRALQRWTSGKE